MPLPAGAGILLSELLTPERVRLPLVAEDKPAALRELTGLLVEHSGGSFEDVLHAITERERVLSTGIGFGVAIPHGRSPTMPDVGLVAGLSPVPIPFDALDGEPVRILFLLAGPESSAGVHVRVLSRIARLVRREEIRTGLLQAESPEAFHATIVAAENW